MSKEFNTYILGVKDQVFRFARKMLNSHEDAQDVVQDLFEKLWKMREQLPEYQNLEAFSIKVTRNLCLDRLKHVQQKTQKLEIIRDSASLTDESDRIEQRDATDIVKNLMEGLPEKQRMVMHLRDIEGMEFTEITEIMNMDVQAVRMNLSRGRKVIREKLIKTMNYGL